VKYNISRPPLFAFLCAALFAFSFAFPQAVWAKDPYARPAGINPTTATLQDVLAKAKKADGSDTPYRTRAVQGAVNAWGLKGSLRSLEVGDDYRSTLDLGAISWSNGRVSGQSWRQNPNGLVTLLHDAAGEEDIDFEALTRYASRPSSQPQLLGETTGPGAAYVIEARLETGSPMWAFYDKKSLLLTRVEIPFVEARDTYTFSDFHKAGPYTDPSRLVISTGVARNDEEYTLSTRYNVSASPADVAMPLSNDTLVQFPAGFNVVSLPLKIANKEGHSQFIADQSYHSIGQPGDMTQTGYIAHWAADPHLITRATIEGHDYDFMLDSGAPGIYVSSDAVAKLGLKSFGPEEQTMTGSWVRAFALVPKMQIGAITMSNAIAWVLPDWHYRPSTDTDAIGLIGYDFIANAALSIDFAKVTLTATNPALFVPPADAVAVPVMLDDGVPNASMQIGQSTANRIVVDTGSATSIILPRFADAHPNDVADQGKGREITRTRLADVDWVSGSYIQYYNSLGGGLTQLRATELKSLSLSGINLENWVMLELVAPTGAAEQIGKDEDGLIGYDFLKYFTVHLDYPHNQIFLEPNALAKGTINH